MKRRFRRHAGLTLIELLVAMLVTAVVLLVTHRLMVTVGDAATAESRTSWLVPADYVAIRDAALNVDTRSAGRLQGSESAVSFPSWCMAAGGWEAPCNVSVAIAQDGAICRVAARLGATAMAAEREGRCALRYLIDADNGGRWASAWADTDRLPAAVALIVSDGDTLLFRVGQRG